MTDYNNTLGGGKDEETMRAEHKDRQEIKAPSI
jgi:hypothetical protein